MLWVCLALPITYAIEPDHTHIPVVSMDLYAQAAAGPEYEYPAWLDLSRSAPEHKQREPDTYGAMIALHPVTGGEKSSFDVTATRLLANSESNF